MFIACGKKKVHLKAICLKKEWAGDLHETFVIEGFPTKGRVMLD
jgi:hypothetical protein